MSDEKRLDVISKKNFFVAWEKYEANKEAVEVANRIFKLARGQGS